VNYAQVQISRSVFSSFGGQVNGSGVQIQHNLGEPIISTEQSNSGFTLTQGFEQPSEGLIVSFLLQGATCNTSSDGLVKVVISGSGNYSYEFGGQLTSVVADTIFLADLLPGTYSFFVTDNITEFEGAFSFVVSSLSGEPCGVYAYSGISPDGDGLDDIWFIEEIEKYPDNMVYVYDRWGNLIWETQGYDNSSNVWNGKRFNQTELPTGTYFYVIEIEGLQTLKGWVQITK